MDLRISVKYGPQIYEVGIQSSARVSDLMASIHQMTNVHPKGQKLICKGKVLTADMTIADAGLVNGAKVMLIATHGMDDDAITLAVSKFTSILSRLDNVAEEIGKADSSLVRDSTAHLVEVLDETEKHVAAAAELKQRLETQQSELRKAEEELHEIKLHEQSLPDLLANLQSTVRTLEDEVSKESAEAEEEARVTRNRLESLTLALDTYSKALGLQYENGEGTLKLVFVGLDANKPDRQFILALHVTENGKYEVDDCSPPVDGLQELVDVVNKTNNLSSFVVSVRNKFLAVSKAGSVVSKSCGEPANIVGPS